MTHTTDLTDADAAVTRWADTVWRLVRCRLRSESDAEDAFQNTFLALVKAHPHFESLEHQKAWLLHVACNCCAQIARTHATHDALPLPERAAENALPERERDRELHEALERLTDKQRQAVHLHYFEGYSTDETARITGEKPSTVRSHLRRARQALKIELERTEGSATCASRISHTDTLQRREV